MSNPDIITGRWIPLGLGHPDTDWEKVRADLKAFGRAFTRRDGMTPAQLEDMYPSVGVELNKGTQKADRPCQ